MVPFANSSVEALRVRPVLIVLGNFLGNFWRLEKLFVVLAIFAFLSNFEQNIGFVQTSSAKKSTLSLKNKTIKTIT